jgi:ribose/xylose/arabinose/galactoside ABC-type transport system permease subunit
VTLQTVDVRIGGLAASIRSMLLSGGLLYVGFFVLILIFAVASPVFLTPENLANIGRQTALVSIMGVGMALVIISGEFDLSVGSVMALSGVCAAMAMQKFGELSIIGVLVALAVGALAGLVNGVLTTWLSIPSFLITLGSLSIARGLALLFTGTRPVNITNDNYYAIFGEGHLLGIPVPIVWTLVVLAVGIVLLHYSTFGRQIYATGGNATAARYTGVDTRRVKTICLVIVGTLAGLAALVLTARSHAARPDAGAGVELDVIAAVILGGAVLSGGRGTIVGALIGSLIIGVLNNGLNLVGVDPSLQLTIKGLIIWFAVVIGRSQ